MIAAPAVDLRGGRCVQLVGGRPEDERVSLPDPVAEAVAWSTRGFETLHVVDLDAALGSGDNLDLIVELVDSTPASVQVGGGIRDDARVERLVEAGADRLVVGTKALDDPHWLEKLTDRYPGRIVLALDTRDGHVLRKGWTDSTGLEITSFLPTVSGLPLAGILATDVGREGRLEGIDRDGCARVIEATHHPVWVSGGVTTVEELEFLERAGAGGVVLGMAIYTSTLDRTLVADRWGRTTGGPE